MSELLNLKSKPQSFNGDLAARDMPSSTGMHPKLVKADYHGSIISGTHPVKHYRELNRSYIVKQSRNTSTIGLEGIVIHETENAFKIITGDDKLKSTLPSTSPLHNSALLARYRL
jgi:ribonuclease P protein subunit POP4